ncbi:hypothetical protein OG339_47975 (plasmid) [Streptosporangium sp. NBC_01495]|uniref:hypothetical protein n=1 Tax=Streptosporangium sp. NBC_01495 TaxID=2903899 RepID=UPI002E34F158|nr:hypothetical protein [Streptosporangium sp. NBC_01495]
MTTQSTIGRLDTRPVELAEEQWALLVSDQDRIDGLTVKDFDDIQDMLTLAQELLSHLTADIPACCHALRTMDVWNISDSANADLHLTVYAGVLKLTTEPIKISSFQGANNTPGEPVLRAVLTELLHRRNELLHDLALTIADSGGLVGYTAHLGIIEEDLDEDVHDIASRKASNINNGGVEEQLTYLLRHLGFSEVRKLLDERAPQASVSTLEPPAQDGAIPAATTDLT